MSTSPRRWAAMAATAAVAALALSACGGESASESAARSTGITSGDVTDRSGSTVPDVLVDGEGATLYVFAPDEGGVVTCTFTCAQNWPALRAVPDRPASATGDVDPDLLGTAEDPGGGEVVTYGGWPLYRYAADGAPGEALGHDVDLNGGLWSAIGADGEPVVR